MSGSRMLAVGALVAAAWFGRGLLSVDAEVDEAPLNPIARYVESAPADLDWQPDPDVRDPFVPLVVPTAPAVEPVDGADE